MSAQGNSKPPISSAVLSNIKRAQAALHTSGPIEVTVHTDFEQDTTIRTNDHDSYNTSNVQVHEKSNVVDGDVERGMQSQVSRY